VVESNHTVVLGWNRQTLSMIRQVGFLSEHCVHVCMCACVCASVLPTHTAVSQPAPNQSPTLRLPPNNPLYCEFTQISIAQAKAEKGVKPFGMPIVVLADRDKAEMDKEVRPGHHQRRMDTHPSSLSVRCFNMVECSPKSTTQPALETSLPPLHTRSPTFSVATPGSSPGLDLPPAWRI
jgi:hypothetical protein